MIVRRFLLVKEKISKNTKGTNASPVLRIFVVFGFLDVIMFHVICEHRKARKKRKPLKR